MLSWSHFIIFKIHEFLKQGITLDIINPNVYSALKDCPALFTLKIWNATIKDMLLIKCISLENLKSSEFNEYPHLSNPSAIKSREC